MFLPIRFHCSSARVTGQRRLGLMALSPSLSRPNRPTQWVAADEYLQVSLAVLAGLVAFRVAMLGGSLPRFSEHDNPASHHPHLLTRYTHTFKASSFVFLAFVPILCYVP